MADQQEAQRFEIGSGIRCVLFVLGTLFFAGVVLLYVDMAHGWPGGHASEVVAGFNFVAVGLLIAGAYCWLLVVYGYWLIPHRYLSHQGPSAKILALDPDGPDSDNKEPGAAADLDQERPPVQVEVSKLTDDETAPEAFLRAAQDLFEDDLNTPPDDEAFRSRIISTWRSTGRGRPNYYFHVRTGNQRGTAWIKVTHAGRGGSGAGNARPM